MHHTGDEYLQGPSLYAPTQKKRQILERCCHKYSSFTTFAPVAANQSEEFKSLLSETNLVNHTWNSSIMINALLLNSKEIRKLHQPKSFHLSTCDSFLGLFSSSTQLTLGIGSSFPKLPFLISLLRSLVIAPFRANTLLFSSFFQKKLYLLATQVKLFWQIRHSSISPEELLLL